MKKNILYFILSSIAIINFSACDLFKIDNYAAPDQTLYGEVVDKATGNRVLTDQDEADKMCTMIRLYELSWTGTAKPTNFDFFGKQDGTFQNTKVFAGYYNVQLWGAFVPLLRINQKGDTIADETWRGDIKGGTTKIKIEVEPFLNVSFVGEPTVVNGRIQVQMKVTRGVTPEVFKQKIEPLGGYNNNFLDVIDIYLFCSETQYVGWHFGRNYWVDEGFSGNAFETKYGFGNTITLTSTGSIPKGRVIFVRVGARIRYQTLGIARINYSDVKRVDMPN